MYLSSGPQPCPVCIVASCADKLDVTFRANDRATKETLPCFTSLTFFPCSVLLFATLSLSLSLSLPLYLSISLTLTLAPTHSLCLSFPPPGETVSLLDVDISRRGANTPHPPTPPPPPRRSLSLLGMKPLSCFLLPGCVVVAVISHSLRALTW